MDIQNAGAGQVVARGLEAVLAYLDRKHAESLAIFGALTQVQLESKCTTPAGTPITTKKWLRTMVEHDPPIFGLTEEAVRARSASL